MAEIMDVSRHQGTIDWAKVKASGKIGGVMIRAMGNSAEGLPSKPYTDPQFARSYAECKRLGIPCGVYGYFKAVDREQADKELYSEYSKRHAGAFCAGVEKGRCYCASALCFACGFTRCRATLRSGG